tara:strand:+ start:1679 stop:2581 length:903 start_codon:yes stop_codon:yes gene_type:complete
MPGLSSTSAIVFARIVPSEINIITTENNNVIDLALCRQVRSSADGSDIWQTKLASANSKHVLSWSSFTESFYGGGDGDFGVSTTAERMLTMIGVSGEHVNGVPQAGSALTHVTDRGRTDSTTPVTVSGVSILNDVIDSVVLDLGLPHEAWDSCSYMNVVNQLQDVHSLGEVLKIQGKMQPSCSLSMSALVHEIAAAFDENKGFKATNTNSAVGALYSSGLEASIVKSMGEGATDINIKDTANYTHILILSIMFKNSTPGVRNVEFRIHLAVNNYMNSRGLLTLCQESADPANFKLDGTQI